MSTPSPIAAVDAAIGDSNAGAEDLIPLLLAVQERLGWLPPEALAHLAARLRLSEARVAGVASFYRQFRLRPAGRHRISVCVGTACHVRGAEAVVEAFRRTLRLGRGEDTDAERRFTLEEVGCLGCCTLAPAVRIDDRTFGPVRPEDAPGVLAEFLASRRRPAAPPSSDPPARVGFRLSLGSCCVARGAAEVAEALRRAVRRTGAEAAVLRSGCVAMCGRTPLVEVVEAGRTVAQYEQVRPGQAEAIVAAHAPGRGWRRIAAASVRALDRWLGDAPPPMRLAAGEAAEFLSAQRRIATENCGALDPLDLDAWRAAGAFASLARAAQSAPEAILAEIGRSGLRGRGGAGFPTGRKWAAVRAEPGPRAVIANGDEGDPGAFMDRMILESAPFRVIEGVAIAARCVGASEGRIYIRAEYPLAAARMREAIRLCGEAGLLGAGDDGFRLRVAEGAGAFVCGEETALLASLAGERGHPRPRPPWPAERGWRDRATLLGNVETFACVPWILAHGAEAFASLGPAGNGGTKVFALAGRVRRTGLVEVPMGTSLRRIVDGLGGGVEEGRTFKAVQIGGPSGGCIPAALADAPVDYESLLGHGAMMGSGGLIALDDRDCMVDLARYFLAFTQAESCGRCAPCRVGTRRLLELLESLCAGEAAAGALDDLERLAREVRDASLCGLGRTAPNPVLSALRHFRSEFEAHMARRCPAGRCKALIRYEVGDRCIGCTLCAQHCPVGAIDPKPYERARIDPARCVRCGACARQCPESAVTVVDADRGGQG